MKILFIANHARGDNQDENATTHALRELGHEVFEIQEKRRHRNQPWGGVLRLADACDWVLFLKHPVVSELQELSRLKDRHVAFWYFDLVDGRYDPTLAARSESRLRWMTEVIPLCRVGFLTDGDYVNLWNTDHPDQSRLVHLPQGADERVAGFGKPAHLLPEILFTGMVHHGQTRASHVEHLKEKFGDRFSVFGDSQRDRVHGRELADVFASTSVVVAPDGPGTDNYWSNRVVLTTSLGGFILHPQCLGLHPYFSPGKDLHYYVSRDHLDQLIHYYLDNPAKRREMAEAGYRACRERNLYRHRCEILIEELKRRS